jgi:hypothetical protein
MAKQTAVEYLMEQLKFTNKEAYAELHCNGEFEKAQQMFKEQTMDAHVKGHNAPSSTLKQYDAEQYYNEVYNW